MALTRNMAKMKDAMGLNTYEARIWSALLSRGIASASELADISHVPRSRCYDVLEALEKKGFVFQKLGKPIKYIANGPEEAMRILQKGIKKEENRMISLYDEIKGTEVFNELKSLYSSGSNFIEVNDVSTSIMGRSDITLFIKGMLSRASHEVLVHASEDNARRTVRLARKAVKKGVPITVFSHGLEDVGGDRVDVRAIKNGPGFIMVDDELLVFTSPQDVQPEAETAVWVQSGFAANMLRSIVN